MFLSKSEYDSFFDGATFGMEFDCGDFDRRIPLPPPHTYCIDEVGSHSRCGIGADPTLKYNLFGGEVQFAPQSCEADLLTEVAKVLCTCLTSEIYFPGTIHMHIRVPKLLERPDLIKKLVIWTQNWWPKFGPRVYQSEEYDSSGPYNEWLYPCTWDVKNLTYPDESLVRMMDPEVDTPRKIALALHNDPDDWKNEWATPQPKDRVKRPAVNFGHLALNETIEFRMFIATSDLLCLRDIIDFPRNYLSVALADDPDPLKIVRGKQFQTQPYKVPNYGGLAETTSGFFADVHRGILIALVNKQITVEDLGCPDYWIKKGFQ